MKLTAHLQLVLGFRLHAVVCGIYCSRSGITGTVFLNMMLCSVLDPVPTLRINVLLPSSVYKCILG